MHDQPKLCECGCGQPAPIATKTQRRQGAVKGEPQRFIIGHVNRVRIASTETRRKISEAHRGRLLPPEQRRTWSLAHGGTGEPLAEARHRRLALLYPKSGICDECGKAARTHYAFLRHPEPHTEVREDYRELCPPCHVSFDSWLWTKETRPARPYKC